MSRSERKQINWGPDWCRNPACDICYADVLAREAEAEAPAEARDLSVWTSADGRKTPITEMTDGHLANTIAFLERKLGSSKRTAWLPALRAERERRIERIPLAIKRVVPGQWADGSPVPRREVTGEWVEAASPNPFEGLVRSIEVPQLTKAPLFEASRARAKANLAGAAAFNDRAEARAKLRASLTGSGPKTPTRVERAPQPVSEPEVAMPYRGYSIEEIMDPPEQHKGIPVDDIMDVLRENIVQYEERKRG